MKNHPAARILLGMAVCAIAGWWFLQGDSSPRPTPVSTGEFGQTARVPTRRGNDAPRLHVPAGVPHADVAYAPPGLAAATESDWENPAQVAKLMAILIHWAAQDPAACSAWLMARPEALRMRLIPEVAGSMVAENPLGAFHLLNELPSTPKSDEMIRQAAMEYATWDPAAALEWANSQNDDSSRELLLSAVYCVQAESQPAAAAAAALKNLQVPAQRDRVVVEILERWVQQDALAAAGFSATLAGATAVAAATAVAGQWVTTDAPACAEWILTLPSPESRASAFTAFVDYQIRHDRTQLEQLSGRLLDPVLSQYLQGALVPSPAPGNP
jgi:hypothetical protein